MEHPKKSIMSWLQKICTCLTLVKRNGSWPGSATWAVLSALTLAAAVEVHAQPFPDTVITLENQKPGTTNWLLTSPALNREIEGYASLTSVNRGGQINLLVNTTNLNYILEVFRIGWYGGTGARELLGPVTNAGYIQPPPARDQTTGLTECNWTNPFTLNIPATPGDPTDWASGAYVVRLTGVPDGKQSYIIFAVRDDDRPTDLLAQMSFATYQAYNNWGGASLYAFNSYPAPAQKVSFNRPYASGPSGFLAYWNGAGDFFANSSIAGPGWESSLVQWLEREGYDVSYCSSVDVHSNTNFLNNHRAFISMGHDEYWSYPMRWNLRAARDRGLNLAFLSANACYWQVRFEPSMVGGTPNRTEVCYKSLADPVADTSAYRYTTVNFHSPPVNDDESSLLGVHFISAGISGDLVVNDASQWLFTNTGLQPGQILPGLLGYEVDVTNSSSPRSAQVALASPYTVVNGSGQTKVLYSNATSYQTTNGAMVFAAGSMQWSWGLSDVDPHINRPSVQNPAAQQVTRNLLARMANTPTPPATFLFHTDTQTKGRWKSHYGADGYVFPNSSTNLPSYAWMDYGNASVTTYLPTNQDDRSLEQPGSTARYLAGWSSPTNFTMDLNLTDQNNHQVAFYFCDWNHSNRTELVEILDANTTNLLDRRVIANFDNGQWWVWQVKGHVQFRFTNLAGPDCLVNALTFGNGAAARYIAEDLRTHGFWNQYYGADGHWIAGAPATIPSYGNLQPWSFSTTNWNTTNSDPRLLKLAGSGNGSVAVWEASGLAGFKLNLTDNNWHKLAIYCLDGDQRGRSQRISLFDDASQAMLDSRVVTNFAGGKYLTWNIRGAVNVRLQNLGPVSSAISGVFLGSTNLAPVVALTSPTNLQSFHLPGGIPIRAVADDMDGSIQQVSFYADGLLLGFKTNAPYDITWNNALVGVHVLSAVAIDNNIARSATNQVNITVLPPPGYQPPVTVIDSPKNGSIFPAPSDIILSASVSASSAPVIGGQFLVDGLLYGPIFSNTLPVLDSTNLYSGMHTISLVVTDAFGVVTSAAINIVNLVPPASSVVFREFQLTHRGHWSGLYGAAGYVLANNVTNLPAYVSLTPLGNDSSVLTSSTLDGRALQNPNSDFSDGFVGVWSSSTNFVLDVNLADGNTHRIELYCLDWSGNGGAQTIQAKDATTGELLDTRTVANCTNGVYVVWDATGHIRFSFNSLLPNGSATLSGVFIDPPRSRPTVSIVTPTNGTCFARPAAISLAAYAYGGTNNLILAEFLTNGTHLAYGDGGVPTSFTWPNPPAGTYAITAWVVDTSGASATSSPVAITIEATSAAVYFVQSDTNHQGDWLGLYGRQGYRVAGGSTNLPSYLAWNTRAQISSWPLYNTDPQALQSDNGTSRIAAAWQDGTNVLFDLEFLDATFHRVTLYFMDWDSVLDNGSNDGDDPVTDFESVDVLDRVSGAVLDHEMLPAFTNGVYEVWDIKGHVQFRIARSNARQAMASGLFLDPSGRLPAIAITNPLPATIFITPTNITLTAVADADTNNVTRVEFYAGSELLTIMSNQPPYVFIWSNAPPGNFSLSAREVSHAGVVDSQPVQISVFASNAVSFLGTSSLPDGTLQFAALGPVGAALRLEAAFSPDRDAAWLPVATNVSGTSFIQFIVSDPTNYPQRFYRLVVLP